MPVVDQSDVETLLGRDLTGAEEIRCARLLDMAEGALQDALPGFSVPTGTETVEIWPRGDREIGNDGTIWTPKYPVSVVHSITVLDLTIPNFGPGLRGFRWTGNGMIVFAPWEDWMPIINAPWLARGFTPYNVTYDFGIDPLPADLAAAIAAPVATILRAQKANPDDLASETLGNYGVHYKNRGDVDFLEAGPVVTEAIRIAIRHWRRTRQVSVPIARHL